MKSLFGMAFVSLLLVTQSFGQAISVNGGSISGSVMDTSGAAVPAAQVKITGRDTGSVKVVTTDSSGLYSVGPLNPGNYSLDHTAASYVFDPQGRAYVSELWWHSGQTSRRHGPIAQARPGRVSVFDPEGRMLARWGGPEASAPGNLAAAHGIAVDSKGDVYVSEVTWTFAVSRGHAPANCHTFQKFALQS